MKTNIYCFFDSASNLYERAFDAVTDGKALEQLEDSVRAMPKAYPHLDKKELCRVASIDVETGIVTPETAPIRIDISNILESIKPIDKIEQAMIDERH